MLIFCGLGFVIEWLFLCLFNGDCVCDASCLGWLGWVETVVGFYCIGWLWLRIDIIVLLVFVGMLCRLLFVLLGLICEYWLLVSYCC